MKVHLDTDLGGDIDDLCALAMLLRWRGVELMGITTVAEIGGKRAGYVRHVLSLEHREEIPVAAGADVSLGCYRERPGLPEEEAYWCQSIAAQANSVEDALLLLRQSVEQGATVVGIGPFTNLRLLEQSYPGILRDAKLYLMGGYIYPPREGFPQWSHKSDYNIQVDVESALYVMERSKSTLIPLTISGETALRRVYLDRLRNSGALGQLLARQAEAFAREDNFEAKYGKTCNNLPHDIINFQHDPLACAIACGWKEGVEITEIPLRLEQRAGWLYEVIDPAGKPTRVVTKIDGERFNEFWINTVSGN